MKILLSLTTSRSAPFDERVEQTILNSLSIFNVSDRPLKEKILVFFGLNPINIIYNTFLNRPQLLDYQQV